VKARIPAISNRINDIIPINPMAGIESNAAKTNNTPAIVLSEINEPIIPKTNAGITRNPMKP